MLLMFSDHVAAVEQSLHLRLLRLEPLDPLLHREDTQTRTRHVSRRENTELREGAKSARKTAPFDTAELARGESCAVYMGVHGACLRK
jgi:hypothetical protein